MISGFPEATASNKTEAEPRERGLDHTLAPEDEWVIKCHDK